MYEIITHPIHDGFTIHYTELNKDKYVGLFYTEDAAKKAAPDYFKDNPIFEIPERKAYNPMSEENGYRFFIETNENDKKNPSQTLYDLICMAARKVASQYGDFFSRNSSLSVDDLVNELVAFVLTRPSITIKHGNSYIIIYRVAKTLLATEKNQRGFATGSFDDATRVTGNDSSESAYHWNRKDLRTALLADWNELPSVIENAINSKRMPEQFREILIRRFRDGDILEPGADRVRLTSAFKRLQEFVNTPPSKADSEFEAENAEGGRFPEGDGFREIPDINN